MKILDVHNMDVKSVNTFSSNKKDCVLHFKLKSNNFDILNTVLSKIENLDTVSKVRSMV